MDRREDEEQRIKSDFSFVIGELKYSWGRRDSDSVFVELKDANLELEAGKEIDVFRVAYRQKRRKPLLM